MRRRQKKKEEKNKESKRKGKRRRKKSKEKISDQIFAPWGLIRCRSPSTAIMGHRLGLSLSIRPRSEKSSQAESHAFCRQFLLVSEKEDQDRSSRFVNRYFFLFTSLFIPETLSLPSFSNHKTHPPLESIACAVYLARKYSISERICILIDRLWKEDRLPNAPEEFCRNVDHF